MIGVIKNRMATLRLPIVSEDVAGERLVLQGQNSIFAFPSEINTSEWETSSFSYHKNTYRQIRFLNLSVSEFQSSKIKLFLSGISLITEISSD